MPPAEIIAILEERFGPAITGKKLDAIDPFVTVDPAHLVAVCRFLDNDPRLRFDLLNCISGVDYLETDAKKVAKAGFEPHLEIVYHLSQLHAPASLRREGDLAALERRPIEGQLPEVPTVTTSGRPPTGTNARRLRHVAASRLPAIPTCGAFCCPRTGRGTPCGRITSFRWSTMGFGAGERFVLTAPSASTVASRPTDSECQRLS